MIKDICEAKEEDEEEDWIHTNKGTQYMQQNKNESY